MSISDDRLAVGAPAGGCVFLYERQGTAWLAAGRLDGALPAARFGAAVAIDGNRLLVGEPGAEGEGGCDAPGRVQRFITG